MSANVRELAQQDPVPNMTARYGQVVEDARKRLDLFVNCLRVLDGLQDDLAEKGVVVNVDLGPIGNAAAATRRDLERDNPNKFKLPTREETR
jgi:hypothetical protein